MLVYSGIIFNQTARLLFQFIYILPIFNKEILDGDLGEVTRIFAGGNREISAEVNL